jgi:hypothetical protein
MNYDDTEICDLDCSPNWALGTKPANLTLFLGSCRVVLLSCLGTRVSEEKKKIATCSGRSSLIRLGEYSQEMQGETLSTVAGGCTCLTRGGVGLVALIV